MKMQRLSWNLSVQNFSSTFPFVTSIFKENPDVNSDEKKSEQTAFRSILYRFAFLYEMKIWIVTRKSEQTCWMFPSKGAEFTAFKVVLITFFPFNFHCNLDFCGEVDQEQTRLSVRTRNLLGIGCLLTWIRSRVFSHHPWKSGSNIETRLTS